MLLRCTTKLLKLLGVRPASLPDVEPFSAWDEWYANLLWIDRRKCLLVTHARTLFSVFVPDVLKSDLTPPGPFLARHIRLALAHEGLPGSTLGLFDSEPVKVARTKDRRILGCMNDQAMHCEYMVRGYGGLRGCSVPDINHGLHRSMHTLTDWAHPIELVLKHLGVGPHNLPLQPPPARGEGEGR